MSVWSETEDSGGGFFQFVGNLNDSRGSTGVHGASVVVSHLTAADNYAGAGALLWAYMQSSFRLAVCDVNCMSHVLPPDGFNYFLSLPRKSYRGTCLGLACVLVSR